MAAEEKVVERDLTPEEEDEFAEQFKADEPEEPADPGEPLTQEEADELIDAAAQELGPEEEPENPIDALKSSIEEKGLPELPPEIAEANKKAASAFAEQRRTIMALTQERGQLAELVEELSTIFGIDKQLDPMRKSEQLREAVIKYRSEKDGIPIEVLRQMQSMESRIRSFADKELELYNQEQWLMLKNEYGLDDVELETFKQELLEDPTVANWGTERLNWGMAYRDKKFKDHEAKVAARIERELEARYKAAQAQSATPPAAASKAVPPPAGADEDKLQVDTMRDFNRMLRELEKE